MDVETLKTYTCIYVMDVEAVKDRVWDNSRHGNSQGHIFKSEESGDS